MDWSKMQVYKFKWVKSGFFLLFHFNNIKVISFAKLGDFSTKLVWAKTCNHSPTCINYSIILWVQHLLTTCKRKDIKENLFKLDKSYPSYNASSTNAHNLQIITNLFPCQSMAMNQKILTLLNLKWFCPNDLINNYFKTQPYDVKFLKIFLLLPIANIKQIKIQT